MLYVVGVRGYPKLFKRQCSFLTYHLSWLSQYYFETPMKKKYGCGHTHNVEASISSETPVRGSMDTHKLLHWVLWHCMTKFQRQHWWNFWEIGWTAYRLSCVHRNHLEQHWTKLTSGMTQLCFSNTTHPPPITHTCVCVCVLCVCVCVCVHVLQRTFVQIVTTVYMY